MYRKKKKYSQVASNFEARQILSPQYEIESQTTHGNFLEPILSDIYNFPLTSTKSKITLPKKKKTLVLDLDETLVHASMEDDTNVSWRIEVEVEGLSCLYFIRKRPFVDYFLDIVSKWYSLVIFTASKREYASKVIDLLDNGRSLFKDRYYRESCISENDTSYYKKLDIIDSDLSSIFIIDNSPLSFALFPDNGVHIETWKNDKNDTSLFDLLSFLDALRFCNDVRSIISLKQFT
ncbi:hypothetical protein ROZALSC1DRAFT_26699 [Rozella allomycis CSF55]|uniref:HAD-like domain-containing protein n=1 Tax=Rozella allomycis (strain CSF55) TaxID=988480 RepID=A0A075AMT5_ROZAC|nr:HAD-like domain-containing protein [Rozella allomycis CSF55]RKP21905.1 hypothetical protein ROZALSC1DRAFT_26699 [Rozella allomycis CSF55]|eukprot:EPZ30978.1 HAD-like domain-containing protein [Rozella allomycis CSF55]